MVTRLLHHIIDMRYRGIGIAEPPATIEGQTIDPTTKRTML
jgi:hypothetical protein